MDAQLILARIASAKEYLSALQESLSADWFAWLAEFNAGKLSLPRALVLVHPDHYAELDLGNTIRGPRQFVEEVGVSSVGCAVNVFWGYPCTSSKVGTVVGDHLFPYSLGGPTVATNKIHLCALHNQMKSNDVHVFPWEAPAPTWLPNCLDSIRRLKVHAQRATP